MLIGEHLINCDDYYVRELASGLNELYFTLSIYDPAYGMIEEEDVVTEGGTPYLVKAINAGQSTVQFKAQLDLDEWRATLKQNYTVTGAPGAIANALKPSGWTVTDSSAIATSVTMEVAGATPLEILASLRERMPSLAYVFDPAAKTLTLRNTLTGPYLGAFLSKQLNLRKIEYKGKSTTFATRLYATGKDGLTFESINNGKAYIDNNTYSSRIVCAYMQDERYETAAELLSAATTALAAMCVPERSYICDAVDLAAIDPETFGHLDLSLFSQCDLIDDARGTKIRHKIIEKHVYPKLPSKNKVVLSTETPRLQNQVSAIVQAISNPNSTWQAKQNALTDTLTAVILGAHGGSVRLLDTNDDGEPDTLYIADSPDIAQAEKVWRFNYEGWAASINGYNGPFTLGATFEDGGTLYANVLKVKNIDASEITTGTLDASQITVDNLNASKITVGTLNTLNAGISGYITLPHTFSVYGSQGYAVTGAGCSNFEVTNIFSAPGYAFFQSGYDVFIGSVPLKTYIESLIGGN